MVSKEASVKVMFIKQLWFFKIKKGHHLLIIFNKSVLYRNLL